MHIYRLEGNDVVALSGVDLDVAAGEVVGLLGPSGLGQVDAAQPVRRAAAAERRPAAPSATHEIARMDERGLARMRAGDVGVVLQGAMRNLLPYADPDRQRAVRPARRAQAAGQRRRIAGLLPEPARCSTWSASATSATPRSAALSPGQRQRLAVAVGLAARPGLLLLDEPTSQLDHEGRDEVLAAVSDVNRDLGTTVVAVTHDPDVAQRLPRTVTIRDGRVGCRGPPRRGLRGGRPRRLADRCRRTCSSACRPARCCA